MEGRLAGLARHLEPLFMQPPPDLQREGLAGLASPRLRTEVPRTRNREIPELVAFATGSLGEFLDRTLESPHLKSLILANSLYGKHGGPYDPGTLFGLVFHLLGGGAESKQGFVGHVMGGMGAITQAMAEACRGAGVELAHRRRGRRRSTSRAGAPRASRSRTGARSRRDSWSRTRTRSALTSSSCPRSALDPEFRARIAGIKMDGPCGKLNLVLAEEPRLEREEPGSDALRRAQFTLVPWLDGAQAAYGEARRGRIAEELWIDCLVPSLIDDSLATKGRHVMTCFVQYLPYALSGSDWSLERERLEAQLIRQIARFVPAVGRSVVAKRLYTPADLESTFGITEGNIFHGDLRPDQLFFMRPVAGTCALRRAAAGALPLRRGHAPGRRRDRRARPQRRAPHPRRPEARPHAPARTEPVRN